MSGLEKTAWRLGLTRTEISLVTILIGFLVLGGILKNFRSEENEAVILRNTEQSRLEAGEVDSLIRLAVIDQSRVDEEAAIEKGSVRHEDTSEKHAVRPPLKKAFSGTVAFNRANRAQLQQVPGIGPVMADRLIAFRREKGGRIGDFQDFLTVKGIGKKKLEVLKKHFTLE